MNSVFFNNSTVSLLPPHSAKPKCHFGVTFLFFQSAVSAQWPMVHAPFALTVVWLLEFRHQLRGSQVSWVSHVQGWPWPRGDTFSWGSCLGPTWSTAPAALQMSACPQVLLGPDAGQHPWSWPFSERCQICLTTMEWASGPSFQFILVVILSLSCFFWNLSCFSKICLILWLFSKCSWNLTSAAPFLYSSWGKKMQSCGC